MVTAALTNSTTAPAAQDFDITVTQFGATEPAVFGFRISNLQGFTISNTRKIGVKWDLSNLPGQYLDPVNSAGNIATFGSDLSVISNMDDTLAFCSTPGTYEVSVLVTDGTNSRTKTVEVTVGATNWDAAETIYVDTSVADGVRPSWAPFGALAYRNSAALAKATVDGRAVRTRIVIADDQTHVNLGSEASYDFDLTIARSGHGTNKPKMNPGSAFYMATGTKQVFEGIHWQGSWDPTTETGGQGDGLSFNGKADEFDDPITGFHGDRIFVDCDFSNMFNAINDGYKLGDEENPYCFHMRSNFWDLGNYAHLYGDAVFFGAIGSRGWSHPDALAGGFGKNVGKNEHGPIIRVSRPKERGNVWMRHNTAFNNITWTALNNSGEWVGAQPPNRMNRSASVQNIKFNYERNTTHGCMGARFGDEDNGIHFQAEILLVANWHQDIPQGDGSAWTFDHSGVVARCNIAVRPDVAHVTGNLNSFGNAFQVPPSGSLEPGAENFPCEFYCNLFITNGTGANEWNPANMFMIKNRSSTDIVEVVDENNVFWNEGESWLAERAAVGTVQLTSPFPSPYTGYQDGVYRPTKLTQFAVPSGNTQIVTPVQGGAWDSADPGTIRAFFDFYGNPHTGKGPIAAVAA